MDCHLWGRTESDTTEATWQQQQPVAKNLPANPGDNRFDPEDPEDPTCHGATKLVVVVMVV